MMGEKTGAGPAFDETPPHPFRDLLDAQLRVLKEGEVIPGRVVTVAPDFVTVDVGYKSEGRIPRNEFGGAEAFAQVKPGDPISVYVERREDEDGQIILSKEKADRMRVWDELSRLSESNGAVEGKIVGKVKGGLAVDIGIKAFLPGSQLDPRPVKNVDPYIGKTFKFKVIKFNRKRGNVILSRKAYLEEQKSELREHLLKTLEEGQVIEGIVKNLTEYGAFIDLGGIDGLLHISDMSWGKLNHPSELVSVGDTIRIKILKYDPERQRVSLGLKQLVPDPWTELGDRYRPNDRVKGKVVSLVDYGAFVEVEPGIEGLVHVSELSWKKVKHPKQLLQIGQVVEAVVLDVDPSARRMALGMKQLEPNPWDLVLQRYPPGTRIQGPIKSITDFGVFVSLEEGVDGLVHVSDLSWTQRIKPAEHFKVGQAVEAVVLAVDLEQERLSLGIKQLTSDPWEGVAQRFQAGMMVPGKVTGVTDFGAFVELQEGVEGLVHISEMSREKVDRAGSVVKVGDAINVIILAVDPRARKISLSMKMAQQEADRREVDAAMARQGDPQARLGDVLGNIGSDRGDTGSGRKHRR